MTRWERQQARQKKAAKRAAREHKVSLRAAVKVVAKVLAGMKSSQTWQSQRKDVVRKALDVLAGEAAS